MARDHKNRQESRGNRDFKQGWESSRSRESRTCQNRRADRAAATPARTGELVVMHRSMPSHS